METSQVRDLLNELSTLMRQRDATIVLGNYPAHIEARIYEVCAKVTKLVQEAKQ